MAGYVVSFGGYAFPSYQAEFNTNFGDGVPVTAKLAGMDGVWNEDGAGDSVTASGKVVLGFNLVANNKTDMDDKRDAVMALRAEGLQKLIIQPTNPVDGQRFCWAKVNFVSMNQRIDEHSDYKQKVSLTFQVPDPHWYGGDYGGDVWNEVDTWTEAEEWGAGGLEQVCAGTETAFTVTQNGNSPTPCAFVLAPQNIGESCQNPRVQRLKDGVVVDEVAYIGTISYGQQLEVDGRMGTITLSGASAFADVTYIHPEFLRLEGGSNSLRVKFANAGDDAVLFLYFYDTWR